MRSLGSHSGSELHTSRAHQPRHHMRTPGSMATTSGSTLTLCIGHTGHRSLSHHVQWQPHVGTTLMAAWWQRGCWCGTQLVADRQQRSWLVRSSLVFTLTQWLGAATGAGCAWVLLVSLGRLWKNFLFHVATSSRNTHLQRIFGTCLFSWVQYLVRQW